MLHIVNGDHVGDKLRESRIQGDILVWREAYPVGPVFLEESGVAERATRADYLQRTLGIPAKEYVSIGESQERVLRNGDKRDEIVLWFEHDLFDLLMLSRLLHGFSSRTWGPAKLNLLNINSYPGIESFTGLGQLSTEQLESLSGTWRPIGHKELETGRIIWEAYASSDIERHVGLLQEDISALPYARAAIEAHLSRLPSLRNGLGIVEQTVLELVGQGVNTPIALFKEASSRLSVLGMGDLEFWYRLRTMSRRPDALIEIQGATTLSDDPWRTDPSLGECVLALTDTGKDTAAGVLDGVKRMGEEWYGGLRLHEDLDWRWDPASKRLVKR